jgi:hypothetical protein
MVSAPPDNLALRLPADAYYHLVRTLCLALPPPLTDNPDDLARRNHAAIAAVAALVPANAAEAILAALFVAASEQCKDLPALGTASRNTAGAEMQRPGAQHDAPGAKHAPAVAQNAGGAREARSEQRHLQQRRLDRTLRGRPDGRGAGTRGDTSGACPVRACPGESRGHGDCRAGRTGRAAAGMAAAPAPAPIAEPEPEPDPLAEAEQYATLYPERAALIRRVGRVPHDVSFGPPDDDLVHTLVTARTPTLAALDREFAQACPMPQHGARAA